MFSPTRLNRCLKQLHLLGTVIVELGCTADTPSFDLSAVLSEVRPNGGVYNVTQGYLRVDSGKTQSLRIILQPICIQIQTGSAIRLSVSGACFPAYPVNLGTGTLPREGHAIEAQIITVTLHTRSSQVLLPVSQK